MTEASNADSPAPPPIVAIHEAGHAVAHFLTAEAMGFAPTEAVWCIEIPDPATALEKLGDDGNCYVTLGTTRGPMFSKAIIDARYGIADRSTEQYVRLAASGPDDKGVVELARMAGADTDSWAATYAVLALGGLVAQAKAQDILFDDLAFAPAGRAGDLESATKVALLAGLSSERAAYVIDYAIDYLEKKWSDPRQWNALLALARSLPVTGRVEGRALWATYSRALEGAEAAMPV